MLKRGSKLNKEHMFQSCICYNENLRKALEFAVAENSRFLGRPMSLTEFIVTKLHRDLDVPMPKNYKFRNRKSNVNVNQIASKELALLDKDERQLYEKFESCGFQIQFPMLHDPLVGPKLAKLYKKLGKFEMISFAFQDK